MDSFLVFLINLLFWGIALFLSFAFHKTVISPLSVYATAWILPSNLNLITVHQDAHLSYLGWGIVWMGFILFVFGYTAILFNIRRPISYTNYYKRVGLSRLTKIANRKLFFQITLSLFFISLIATSINLGRVFSRFGIHGTFLVGREYEYIFAAYTPLNYLYFLNLLVIGLAITGLCLKCKRRRAMKIILFVSLITTLLIGHKITFIIGLLILIYAYSLLRLKIKKRYIIAFLFSIIMVFALVSFIRKGSNLSEVKSSLGSEFQAYIVYNYRNLENLIALGSNGVKPFGLENLPFYNIIERIFNIISGDIEGRKIFAADEYADYFIVNPHYILSTYLSYFYLQHGYIGLIWGPFLIGLVAALLYLKLLRRPNVFVLMANVIYFCMLTFSFSAFEFFRPQFLYLLFLSFLIQVGLSQKKLKGIELK